jgi:hypothetical protein
MADRDATVDDKEITSDLLSAKRVITSRSWFKKAKIDYRQNLPHCQWFKDSQGRYCMVYSCYDTEFKDLNEMLENAKQDFVVEIYKGPGYPHGDLKKALKLRVAKISIHRPNVYVVRI